MTTIGYATLQIIPSLKGVSEALTVAGKDGAAAFGQAFIGSSIFRDISKAMTGALTAGAPESRRAIDLLTSGHRDLAKAAGDSADAASRAGKVFNTIGVASVVAFGGAIALSAKAAGDFQASMTRLTASAGESAGNIQAVNDGILQMAGNVGYGPQQLADAMYNVEKAGFRGADGVKVLTAAAQGGKSENADLKEVLDGLTTSMHDFGYSADQSADVMSKMVAAVGMAKTNFQDFAGALHSVEPIAAALHVSLADVYGSLAQITQSGTSADQAAQNMAHALSSLSKPTQQMRDEMGQFGLNAVDVQSKIGERGLAGTMQYLSNTIRDHMDPAGQVIVDTMYKSQQATDSAKQIFDALPPAAQKVAQAVKDNADSYKSFRKDRGGLDVEQANEVQQWLALNNKITGYSNALKTGQGSVQTYLQALSLMVGGQDAARIALQLTGENADKTNKGIQAIDQTTREHDGTVKGFNETQATLNAKMADFKAAMESARIELGTAFLPALTDVAGALATIGQFFAKHKTLAEALTVAVGALAAAWLAVKAAMIGQAVWTALAGAMNALAGASTAAAGGIEVLGASATAAQAGVTGLIGGIFALSAALGVGLGFTIFDKMTEKAREAQAAIDETNRKLHEQFPGQPVTPAGVPAQTGSTAPNNPLNPNNIYGHTTGGLISGPGTGISDSILLRASNGEFIVNAAAARKNLPLLEIINSGKLPGYATGGVVAPDVSAAEKLVGHPYSQGSRFDCSGDVARVINAALGMGGGLMSTKTAKEWLAARGFKPGIGGPGMISVGWYDHGPNPNDGHMAMTLSDGRPAEGGGSHGVFLVGAGASGASSPQFDQHMFLPTVYGEGPAGSSTASPFAGGSASAAVTGGGTAPPPSVSGGGTSSSSGGGGSGFSLPSSIGGLASFGLDSLGKGVGTTGSGSDLSLFGKAAGSAVSGQVDSLLGVFGVPGTPGWLKAASMLVGGIKVGGGSSAAPLSATPTITGTPPPGDAGTTHGSRAGQAPGPQTVYNIRTATVEDAFLQAQRKQNERNAAKLSRF